jgi:predicted RNA binding protein YcfA (HicA-like mRNA interferase family)
MRPVIEYAVAHGWGITRRKNSHLAFKKGGHMVVTSSTPSCRRAPLNALAQLKRMERTNG